MLLVTHDSVNSSPPAQLTQGEQPLSVSVAGGGRTNSIEDSKLKKKRNRTQISHKRTTTRIPTLNPHRGTVYTLSHTKFWTSDFRRDIRFDCHFFLLFIVSNSGIIMHDMNESPPTPLSKVLVEAGIPESSENGFSPSMLRSGEAAPSLVGPGISIRLNRLGHSSVSSSHSSSIMQENDMQLAHIAPHRLTFGGVGSTLNPPPCH